MEKENKNKELFIISENGTIISGKDKSKLNGSLKELVHGDWRNDKVGSFIGLYNGERVFVVFNSIDYGWKTVSIVSYNSLLMNVKIAFSRLFTIAIVNLILSVILIYLTARWFTKRIETLLQLTRRIEREDFNVRAVSIWHDEVGQLSFAMIKMARRMKELINEVYKKEIAKKESEMNMLQAQINPHFLYNTLASISSLAIRSGDNRIQDMVTHLAKFYRISLNKGKTIVGFNEELKLTKS
jgi:two-component system sensor histidine kinase YesM